MLDHIDDGDGDLGSAYIDADGVACGRRCGGGHGDQRTRRLPKGGVRRNSRIGVGMLRKNGQTPGHPFGMGPSQRAVRRFVEFRRLFFLCASAPQREKKRSREKSSVVGWEWG